MIYSITKVKFTTKISLDYLIMTRRQYKAASILLEKSSLLSLCNIFKVKLLERLERSLELIFIRGTIARYF